MTEAMMHTDNSIDDHIDDEIESYLNLDDPKSFFLFAGAGSGKTRSLVEALHRVRRKYDQRLRLHGQKIAVITYTNKARKEIIQRLDFDNLIEVSTIHSFVWLLIQGLNNDIKTWLKKNLQTEIADLNEKQAKGREGTQTSKDRAKSIDSKTKRLAVLDSIKVFNYSPNGNNHARDSLNHSEVIKIAADFLTTKPVMQRLLVNRFPILLIDESQDTNKKLMEAFLTVQAAHAQFFCLGLLGDTMQRIYEGGKTDLGEDLPSDWMTPAKTMNHRCPGRVVKLINKIRSEVDDQVQKAREDKGEGFVRLFILRNDHENKSRAEQDIIQRMAKITGDEMWRNNGQNVKSLILEHHMAAKRLGFLDMYTPLYKNNNLKIGLLDGSLSGLKFFSDVIFPLVEAKKNNDSLAVARLVRKHSPLLNRATLQSAGGNQKVQIKKAKVAVDKLWTVSQGHEPKFIDMLKCVEDTNLFEIPESLQISLAKHYVVEEKMTVLAEDETTTDRDLTNAASWDKFLNTKFEQIKVYSDYVQEKASFNTHQGVKGLEFPRVMVIIDDTEANGFLFKYDKLFGVNDIDNKVAGKETAIDRTRRLFYVTCSRAEESLAIVAYTQNPDILKKHVVQREWFADSEVEII